VTTPLVEGFFDFACPWSYLAFNRAREAAMRTGSTLEWRPVQGAGIEALLQEPNGPLSARQAAYQQQDLQDWASYCGIKINRSGGDAGDSTAALKGAFLALEHGLEKPYMLAVFEAYWADGADISDEDWLVATAVAAGLDEGGFREWLLKPAVAEALQRNAAEYVERGGFATPGFFVAGKFIAGNERMPLVELALGQASDIEFVLPGMHGGPEADELVKTKAGQVFREDY